MPAPAILRPPRKSELLSTSTAKLPLVALRRPVEFHCGVTPSPAQNPEERLLLASYIGQ